MLFQTTAAHEELRAKIRSFAEEEIKPRRRDRGIYHVHGHQEL